ncbi:D-alanyl-D-alanine carboxypeptidase [Candidatus Gottesmanbacteria bacterium]|nr:D-alanyl-D-alanine carboxypeptidase [Candidatus Gottesmanbacteria bacterium]
MSSKSASNKKKKSSLVAQLKRQPTRIAKIFILAFILFLFPAPYTYQGDLKQLPKSKKTGLPLPPPPLFPINYTGIYPQYLTAEGVVVIDMHSGVILYNKNPHSRLSPASTTKIATALVALDHFKLDDILTVRNIEYTRNIMGLVPQERITFESLLYGLLIYSANDAALTIAENYPGGVPAFVVAMNKKALSLDLPNTHFANPIGFDDPEQYISARDLAKLAQVSLKNKTISKMVGIRSITVSDVDYQYFHELRNVNQLLGQIAGVAGIKTGFTQNAAECLVSYVKRKDNEIIMVVLRSSDRFKETEELISWVFQNFKWVDIVEYQKSIQANLAR